MKVKESKEYPEDEAFGVPGREAVERSGVERDEVADTEL